MKFSELGKDCERGGGPEETVRGTGMWRAKELKPRNYYRVEVNRKLRLLLRYLHRKSKLQVPQSLELPLLPIEIRKDNRIAKIFTRASQCLFGEGVLRDLFREVNYKPKNTDQALLKKLKS